MPQRHSNKVPVKVVSLGMSPRSLDIAALRGWRSQIFEISDDYETLSFRENADDDTGWQYSDELLERMCPKNDASNLIIAVTRVGLTEFWTVRPLRERCHVITFMDVADQLEHRNIPLSNLVLRIIYPAVLQIKSGNTERVTDEKKELFHDDPRGCIFDVNPTKDFTDVCNSPCICDQCKAYLLKMGVSNEIVSTAQVELKKIRKRLYFRMVDWVKNRPIETLVLSSSFAIFLGTVGSLLASYIWELLKG